MICTFFILNQVFYDFGQVLSLFIVDSIFILILVITKYDLRMKSFVIVIFTFFYFIASAGIVVNIHYCGGKFKNISLPVSKTKSCCGAEMETNDCCHNEFVSFKVKDKHEPVYVSKINKIKAVEKFNCVCFFNEFKQNTAINSLRVVTQYHSPPILYKTPLFVLNCVYLI